MPVRSDTVGTSPGALRRLRLKHPEEEVVTEVPLNRKRSQKEQDLEDDKAHKRAMRNLVDSWQERLQLISVITTFFASIEAGMLVPLNTDPNVKDASPRLIKTANAGFLGALTMHVYAAVLSFLGAFLLIRYKLKEASIEEYFVDNKGIEIVASPENGSLHAHDTETGATRGFDMYPLESVDSKMDTGNTNTQQEQERTNRMRRMGTIHTEPPILSREPHLEQVGFWSSSISSHMLRRVHALCIILAGVGFILAMIGIMMYIWALQPREVSILATTFLGVALFATVAILFLPDEEVWPQLIARYNLKRLT